MRTVVCPLCYDSVDVFSKAISFTCKNGHETPITAPKYRYNSHVKVKAKRPVKRTKRIKLVPIPKLVKKADTVFSKFIRHRDKVCVLCGSNVILQCGHLIKRSKKLVRFSEKNCNALCSGCNYKDNHEHDHYVMWFINKYGVREYETLLTLSKMTHKWTREELFNIIKKYECNPFE